MIRRTRALSSPALTWVEAMGLGDGVDPADLRAVAERLAEIRLTLPWSLAALLPLLALLASASGAAPLAIAIPGLLLIALSGGLLLLLHIARRAAPPVLARVTAAYGLGCGIVWASLVASLPLSPATLTGQIGGVAILAVLLIPIPAAAIAAILPVIGALLLRTDAWVAATILTTAACLCGAVLGSARRERIAATRRIADAGSARKASHLLAEFEENRRGWFWETDPRGCLTYISPQLAEAIGHDHAGLIGSPFAGLVRSESDDDHPGPRGQRTLGFHLSTRLPFSEVQVRAAVEGDRWWSLSGRPATDDFGNFVGFRGNGTDLTERRRSEREISTLAKSDALTGLPNRTVMGQTLEAALLGHGERTKPCAVFLIDLDRFKSVNDTLGHPLGDVLLRQVAERLRVAVGEVGQVGRLGGDEFQVVIPEMADRARLAAFARAIIERLSAPYMIEGHHVSIGASIGVAAAPGDGTTAEALVRNADLALYAAKADGKGIHRFYEAEMHANAKDRRLLEMDLRTVLSDGGLHLVYQPVVNAGDERIVGFEALIRWNHPTRGAVRPDIFIPIAEEIGLIPQIGEWVIRTACQTATQWPEDIRVAVNVSPLQFLSPALPGIVMSALAATQLPPNRLELEITEGVFMGDGTATDAMFDRLKKIGVRFALDDFGTGYSSLGYLKKAPFNKIKIDQSFVRGAAIPGNRNAAIVRAIVALATSLDMDTTAEGAETVDELELIRSLGCSHVQGYVFGRPMPAEEALARVRGTATLNPTGFLASRSPRVQMLRSTLLHVGGRTHSARLRNLSSGGAMVETAGAIEQGAALDIELPDGRRQPAVVRWARDGRAGMTFDRAIDLEALTTRIATPPRMARLG